jgi:hypothetical protein
MRDEDIRSTTFRTKTELSDEKNTLVRVGDEVQQQSQTGAIGFEGRTGENRLTKTIADSPQKARSQWLRREDSAVLRSTLLRLLLDLDATTPSSGNR